MVEVDVRSPPSPCTELCSASHIRVCIRTSGRHYRENTGENADAGARRAAGMAVAGDGNISDGVEDCLQYPANAD